MTAIHPRALPALLLLMAGVSSVHAEDVAWHSDYAKAVGEAAKQGKPLFINVGSDDCYWCKQLDQRTFVNDEIQALLKERFVVLKVNGSRNRYLVDALRIQSYPTLVFAAPDGSIVGYKEGFQEAAALKQQLLKVLTSVGTPDWMMRDYEAAVKAADAADYARALTLLRNVAEDGKDRPVQIKARALVNDVEKRAAEAAAAASALAAKGKTEEAVAAYGRLGKDFPGTLAARQGKQAVAKLASRSAAKEADQTRQASELLEQAKLDYRAERYLSCLDRCEALADAHPETTEAKEAGRLADQIKDNPEWTRRACDQLGERLAVLYLALADSWLKKGQPQQAVYYLERVTKTFPDSKHAEQAQARLIRLRGTPESKR
jgi:thioredoxin-related protein